MSNLTKRTKKSNEFIYDVLLKFKLREKSVKKCNEKSICALKFSFKSVAFPTILI